jgi:predicted enzyme related to lactoylglutathione lyase
MSRIVLWVSDINHQADFYSALFDASPKSSTAEYSEISDGHNAVLLHALPEQYRTPAAALQVQEEVAIKPIFSVSNIEDAQSRVARFNVRFGSRKNIYGDIAYLDCIDPEGNVIQLSEKMSAI